MSIGLRALCVLGTCLGLTSLVSAALITQQYVQVQVSDTPSFSTFTTINLAGQQTPSITLQAGQYLRFGVAIAVTGDPNPAFNGSWDLANQNVNGNSAQPQNLGLAVIGMQFSTSDGLATVVAPLTTPPPTGKTFPQSTAVINGNLNFDSSESGDVAPATGIVGSPSDLGGGYASADPTTPVGVGKLSAFTTQTNLFTRLAFQAVGVGTTTLSQSVDLTPTLFNQVGLWENVSPGSVDTSGNPATSASYDVRRFDAAQDTFNFLPTLTVNVVPEPSALGMIALAACLGLRRRSLRSR